MAAFITEAQTDADRERYEAEYQDHLNREATKMYDGPLSSVPTNLRKFRLRKKLKKSTMATFMEITPRTYYAYEKGLRSVPSDALVNLATMTGVDLNEILMGRTSDTDFRAARKVLDDVMIIVRYLVADYPKMDVELRYAIARHAVTADTGNWPRTHPEMIASSVRVLTGYKYDRSNIPSPPNPDDYGGDMERYERDDAAWYKMVYGDLDD